MTERVYFGWGVSVTHIDSFNSVVVDQGVSVKPFRGETAWSDAERYANDLVLKRVYA